MSRQLQKNLMKRYSENKLHNLYLIEGNRIDEDGELLKWVNELLSSFLRSSSSRISVENHTDIEFIAPNEKKKFYQPEHLQQIFKFLHFEATDISRKFLIITQSGKVQESQANKLLKTFEEPPVPLTTFLLNPTQTPTLPTINSRAIKIKLSLSSQSSSLPKIDYNMNYAALANAVTKGEVTIEELSSAIYHAVESKKLTYTKLEKIKTSLAELDQDILYNAAEQSKVHRLYNCIQELK